jgi:hypothetical protein
MTNSFYHVVQVEPYRREPLEIICPRSYLSDRAVPLIEVATVPARSFDGGKIEFVEKRTSGEFCRAPLSLKGMLRALREQGERCIGPDTFVDLRSFGTENWSHALNQALPCAIFLNECLRKEGEPTPKYLISPNTSVKFHKILSWFNINFSVSNRIIEANQFTIDFDDLNLVLKMAPEFLKGTQDIVEQIVASSNLGMGGRIFLNRRGSQRSLINGKEITDLLAAKGFVEVFMEDHSPEDQIAMIVKATDIVAIHGAALAPLIFRRQRDADLRLIEIASPGHVVPFYRDMVQGLPVHYRMVRGVPDEKMARDAFRNVNSPSMKFTIKHSLRPFLVDPESLKVALEPSPLATPQVQ